MIDWLKMGGITFEVAVIVAAASVMFIDAPDIRVSAWAFVFGYILSVSVRSIHEWWHL